MGSILGNIFGKKKKVNTGQGEAQAKAAKFRKESLAAAQVPDENIFTTSLGDTSKANIKKKKLLGS